MPVACPPMSLSGGHEMPQYINIPIMQYHACCDSLKRAEFAAHSAQDLCYKAARAFADEKHTLYKCRDVFATYL